MFQAEKNDIEFISVLSPTTDQAVCSVLRIAELRIMFDCGCNEQLDEELLKAVYNQAKNVDFIMISHASCYHVGALPYLWSRGIRCRMISTSPCAKLGAQTMYEIFISKKECP